MHTNSKGKEMQKIIRNINSAQFGLSVQDAILNGYLVTKSFGKPSVGYMAVMSQDKKAQLTQIEQKIDYQLNLNLRDTNPLHFALKLQQAILGGYRIKPDLRFGKFGVVWYASLEIGKSQLEELLKGQSEPLVEVVVDVVEDAEPLQETPKKRTTKSAQTKQAK